MKEQIKITSTDGFPISVTAFNPGKFNGRVVLINSATGVKQNYYSDFAVWLTQQGFKVFTYDYRGIGESKPSTLKKFEASMEEWGTKDYHSVLKYLFSSHPDAQVVVIGHSVGGQIVGMSPLSENVDLFVHVGSQTPYWRNFQEKGKLILFWYLMIPLFTRIYGYFPAKMLGLFEDLPAGVARQWARWAKTDNYVFDEKPSFKDRFSTLQQPSLMISFADDQLAPKPAVDNLKSFYKNKKWSHIHVQPQEIAQNKIGHFGFFKNTMTTSLWYDLLNWTNKQLQLKESKAA